MEYDPYSKDSHHDCRVGMSGTRTLRNNRNNGKCRIGHGKGQTRLVGGNLFLTGKGEIVDVGGGLGLL